MTRAFKSAFALSLIIFSFQTVFSAEEMDVFLGLESEVLPELKGSQRFTPENFHTDPKWNIKPEKTFLDKDPLKGQGYSIIPWKDINPEKFLDIETWLVERAIKDKNPDWQIRLRDLRHQELVGKVIQCKGKCPVYRGENSADVQHLSRILEGDEVHSEKDSVLWLYLMDGTLLRLSGEASISFHEINFAKDRVLIVARLNYGHAFIHSRSTDEFKFNRAPETDSYSLPLLVKEANQEYFERKRFAAQTDFEHLKELADFDEGAIKDQTEKINELRKKNSWSLKSQFMLIAPNVTLLAEDSSFDVLHVQGDKTYFHNRSSDLNNLKFFLRGYTNTETHGMEEALWHEVAKEGREFNLIPEKKTPAELQISSLLTERIKTMELAREIWMDKFSMPLQAHIGNPKDLATKGGYNLWGEEIDRRLEFLKEYSRRTETTQLKSQENLYTRLREAGEFKEKELNEGHYRKAVHDYLWGLKNRYSSKNLQVREFNDLQYYVWILKNGKL
jgi:hypothetical protein